MPDGGSEEKTLPPSKKKLDDARLKGQVAQSKDMVTAVTMIGALGVVAFGAGGIATSAMAMMDATGEYANSDLWTGLAGMGGAVKGVIVSATAPVLGVVVAGAVLGNMAVLRGFLFATDPITPKLSNVSPVEGFQKLFKLKTLIELIKSLAKLVVLTAVLAGVLYGGLRGMVMLPSCGLGCVAGVMRALFLPMMGAAALMFLIAGFADLGLQRWLFTRDQRMGHSERKRETKEQDGDPQIRAQRRKLSRESSTGPAVLGVAQAVLMLHDGGARVVGLRFKRGEMPVPVVVCRGTGERARTLMADAGKLGIPCVENEPLVQALSRRAPPGSYIPESTYGAAAQVLAQHGLV